MNILEENDHAIKLFGLNVFICVYIYDRYIICRYCIYVYTVATDGCHYETDYVASWNLKTKLRQIFVSGV